VLKRYYKPEWGDQWKEHFTVDMINGKPGNELKCDNRKLVTNYMRVGFQDDGLWRTFGLRKDFNPAIKQSLEDDITASVVVASRNLEGVMPDHAKRSVKFLQNCEYRFFQRPDDAIIRGYDKLAEAELAQTGNFISNFEPLVTRGREGDHRRCDWVLSIHPADAGFGEICLKHPTNQSIL
jgi:hypothetical protein